MALLGLGFCCNSKDEDEEAEDNDLASVMASVAAKPAISDSLSNSSVSSFKDGMESEDLSLECILLCMSPRVDSTWRRNLSGAMEGCDFAGTHSSFSASSLASSSSSFG